jgi:hypothetical protein
VQTEGGMMIGQKVRWLIVWMELMMGGVIVASVGSKKYGSLSGRFASLQELSTYWLFFAKIPQ